MRECGNDTRGVCARCECAGELEGCGGDSAGTCQVCDGCEEGQERVGCRTVGVDFDGGVCRPAAVLARSLECPLTGGLVSGIAAEPPVGTPRRGV